MFRIIGNLKNYHKLINVNCDDSELELKVKIRIIENSKIF